MLAVTTGAVPGSSVKCGLPDGWTSPSERSIGAGADLEHRQPAHGLDHARRAAQEPWVAAALDDRIDPRVLVQAVAHQDLGALDQQYLAGTNLQIVRILARPRRHLHVAQLADEGAGDRPEVGQRGQHAQALLGRRGGGMGGGQDDEHAGQHHASDHRGRPAPAHQNRSVGCAPRMKLPCRSTSLTERSTEPVPSVCLYCTRKRRNSDGLNCRYGEIAHS